MARILICCAESTKNKIYTSNDSLIRAFRKLGHDVITAGPVFGNYEGELQGTIRDIRVYDRREHPEIYTYEEILSKCDKKPDIILQIDPHFYLKGKPPSGITSIYYIVDVHRGASVFREMAKTGNFDFVFLAHKHFAPLFENIGIKTYWLPRAFDDEFIKEYPEIKQECDLVFVGENGFTDKMNTFNAIDEEIGIKYHSGAYPAAAPWDKFRSWENHSMEYAERAEILHRLSQDFDLRVYQDFSTAEANVSSRGINYAKIMCRGKIIANHSLWYDSALRNFEVLACNRFLITDMLPNQNDLLINKQHYIAYDHYFLPFLDNFKLEYEIIRDRVEYYLLHEKERKEMSIKGRDFVLKYHTFKHRAQTIIDTINGEVKGYVRPN